MHITNTENKNWISRVVEAAQNHDGMLLGAATALVAGFVVFFVGRKTGYNK